MIVILVIIAVLLSVAIDVILRFLVTTNRIKPNKVTRLFYYDKIKSNESFIKSWEKTKEKGILIYNIKTVIMFTTVYGIIGLIYFSKDNNSIMYGREHIPLLVITFVFFSLITSLVIWGIKQDRYSKLKEKVENDNM